ncbi:unnamed protein product [Oikopleura dioica]|uniref:Uncharacterized protein n=1 Tax=Oikopleura dioica TaxID=34765 RepID=E4XPT5_OIKDI|nr:unnamed protein product [Oikopleura dioica]
MSRFASYFAVKSATDNTFIFSKIATNGTQFHGRTYCWRSGDRKITRYRFFGICICLLFLVQRTQVTDKGDFTTAELMTVQIAQLISLKLLRLTLTEDIQIGTAEIWHKYGFLERKLKERYKSVPFTDFTISTLAQSCEIIFGIVSFPITLPLYKCLCLSNSAGPNAPDLSDIFLSQLNPLEKFFSLVLIAKSADVASESFEFIKHELRSSTDIFCQTIMLHELGRILVEAKLSKISKSAILLFEEIMQGDLPRIWPLKINNIIRKMIASENDIIRRRGDQFSKLLHDISPSEEELTERVPYDYELIEAIGRSLMDYLSDRDSFQLEQSQTDDDIPADGIETAKVEPVVVHYLPTKRTRACSDICTGPEKEIPKARHIKKNDKKLIGIIKSFNKDLFPDYDDNKEDEEKSPSKN